MCSAPRPKAPEPIKLPKLPDPPPPPPVPVLAEEGRPNAAVIRKTSMQKAAKWRASRGTSQLRIPLAKKMP